MGRTRPRRPHARGRRHAPPARDRAGDATLRLRETVQVFLDAQGSFTDAAARMHVHKNTVHYRVRKAEEILGHPLTANRLDIEVALLACAQLGLGGAGAHPARDN
ncbi:helix-turn-helix domain-containing protein [Streptomyces bottropensis]|uniref:helix-turn-helix domain-containing protein n=1 Tax=Streptomyces bottropensis TaxID=42235 RepID=UPI0036A1CD8A